jgi:hypothetical protein
VVCADIVDTVGWNVIVIGDVLGDEVMLLFNVNVGDDTSHDSKFSMVLFASVEDAIWMFVSLMAVMKLLRISCRLATTKTAATTVGNVKIFHGDHHDHDVDTDVEKASGAGAFDVFSVLSLLCLRSLIAMMDADRYIRKVTYGSSVHTHWSDECANMGGAVNNYR